jgi:single-strand DNA-binding protein
MLKTTIIGNIGADAIVRETSGKQAISFKVAHNEKYTTDGVKHEKTVWIDCTIWRERVTTLPDYLKRGQKVYLEGIPSADAYTNKETGELISVLRLNVRHIELL